MSTPGDSLSPSTTEATTFIADQNIVTPEIDMPATPGTPGIRWKRQSDGTLIAWVFGDEAGIVSELQLNAGDLGNTARQARISAAAFGAGNRAAVLYAESLADDPGTQLRVEATNNAGATIRKILLAADGSSDFAGGEIAYAEHVATVNCAAGTDPAPILVVSAPTIALDGNTPIKISYFAPSSSVGSSSGLTLSLWGDGAELGGLVVVQNGSATSTSDFSLYGERELKGANTPAQGNHDYSIRGWRQTGAAIVGPVAGPGGPGQLMPGFIRISHI